MKKLGILGASGHGKVLADMAELTGWHQIAFFDDAWPSITHNGHWPIAGDTTALLARLHEFDGLVVGIGNNAIRLSKQALLLAKGATMVSLVHPSAQVSRYTKLGIGSVVMAGAIVNADSHIGAACIINTNASVDHDCILADGVHLSPTAALAGGVKVGRGAWIGIGASVRQLTHIHAHAVVGAGSVVINTVLPHSCVVGNPARLLQKHPTPIFATESTEPTEE